MSKQDSVSIQWMRVIGMFYVALGNHFFPHYYPNFFTKAFSQFFGFLGVGMFFAASGYLFGRKARCSETVGTSIWLVKRLKRIMLPYWLILTVVVAIRMMRHEPVTAANLIVSYLNLQGILQLRYAFPELGHTWFISIIMVCYFLVCIWAKKKDSSAFWKVHGMIYAVVILLFALFGQLTAAIYTGYILLTSILFYCGYHDIKIGGGGTQCTLAVIGALCIRALSWVLFDDTPIYTVVVAVAGLVSTFGYFSLGLALGRKSKPSHSPRVVSGLNDISYEFYLTHALFLCGATSLAGIFGAGWLEIILLTMLSILSAKLLNWIVDFIVTLKG